VSRPAPGDVHREPLVVVDEDRAERRSLLLTRDLPPMPLHHLEHGAIANA
jgi:hypothetical protein